MNEREIIAGLLAAVPRRDRLVSDEQSCNAPATRFFDRKGARFRSCDTHAVNSHLGEADMFHAPFVRAAAAYLTRKLHEFDSADPNSPYYRGHNGGG